MSSVDERRQARQRAEQVARSYRLPLRSRTWRGHSGNWAGAGVGSSIDYQDHRPYAPGDDPRYIDWLAYARSGLYVMKLYREEVSPTVELVVDTSRSMSFDDHKRRRSLELFYFAISSTVAAGGTLRCWLLKRTGVRRVDLDLAVDPRTDPFEHSPAKFDPTQVNSIPFRPSSLRILISDLLFPGPPEPLLRVLAANKGRCVVLAPSTVNESSPDWDGSLELRNCEDDGERRLEHFDGKRRERYLLAYARHFELWSHDCRQRGVTLARLSAEVELAESLRTTAATAGAVEPWR